MHAQLLDAIPLTAISGVGAAIAEKLGKLGILNLQDLLFHLPDAGLHRPAALRLAHPGRTGRHGAGK